MLAFPRSYSISNIELTVPTMDTSGAPWDVAGGAPDLFVEINVNGAKVATTAVVNDMFSATFPGPFLVQLAGGATLRFDSFDEDLSANDGAYTCEANPITALLIRGRRLACMTSGYSMTIDIVPR